MLKTPNMRLGDLITRLPGLARLAVAKLFLRGRLSFHPVQNVSPWLYLFIGPSARLVLGRNATLERGVDMRAVGTGVIEVGERVYMGPRCMLSSHSGISIGRNTLLGPDVKVFDNNHEFVAGIGVLPGRHMSAPVRIGANCWLGANVVILKGVTIGDGSVIAAGCVIRQDVPPYSLATSDAGLRVAPLGKRHA